MKTYTARFVGEFERDEDGVGGKVGDFLIVNVRDALPGAAMQYFRLVCPCGRDHLLPLNGSGVTWGLVSKDPPTIAGSILSHCVDGLCDHARAVQNGTHCHVIITNGQIEVLDDTTATLP